MGSNPVGTTKSLIIVLISGFYLFNPSGCGNRGAAYLQLLRFIGGYSYSVLGQFEIDIKNPS